MAAQREMMENAGNPDYRPEYQAPVIPKVGPERSGLNGAAVNIINSVNPGEPEIIDNFLTSMEGLVKQRISENESGMRVKTVMATAMFISATMRTPEEDLVTEVQTQRFMKDRDEAWVAQIEKKWPSGEVRLLVSDPLIERHYLDTLERVSSKTDATENVIFFPQPQVKDDPRLN